MHTIPEIDEIAKRATERIAKEFAESGFANPPVVTHGIARAVLEAAEQLRAPDALRCTSDTGEHYYLTYEKCVFCKHERG